MSTADVSQFGKVAVMFGGNSAERQVSLNSGQAVLDALCAQGVDAHKFDPAESKLAELTSNNFERVFIVLHGRGGEDGSLQGALTHMNLPYTGSGSQGSALAMDKVRSKYLFAGAGVPTAKFLVARKGETIDERAVLQRLNGKVMVKPANEGSSIGMSKAETVSELAQALVTAFEFDDEVLIEQWVTGREFTVSVLNDEALPVIEMRTDHEFYDYDAKYKSGDTEYLCPAPISEGLTQRLQRVAIDVFKLVGLSGWGRVDFLVTEQEELNVLEVNTVPGMTQTSLVPKAAKAKGIDFEQLVVKILQGSL